MPIYSKIMPIARKLFHAPASRVFVNAGPRSLSGPPAAQSNPFLAYRRGLPPPAQPPTRHRDAKLKTLCIQAKNALHYAELGISPYLHPTPYRLAWTRSRSTLRRQLHLKKLSSPGRKPCSRHRRNGKHGAAKDMPGSKIAVRMAGLPFEKPRVRAPSRPLPAGTQHWPPLWSTRAGEAAKLGMPIHPHTLRHSTGFKLANDGQDTRAIQHYLGHRNIQHTVLYTHLAAERFNDFWDD